MADRLESAQLADGDAAAIAIDMAAGERCDGGELRRQRLAQIGSSKCRLQISRSSTVEVRPPSPPCG